VASGFVSDTFDVDDSEEIDEDDDCCCGDGCAGLAVLFASRWNAGECISHENRTRATYRVRRRCRTAMKLMRHSIELSSESLDWRASPSPVDGRRSEPVVVVWPDVLCS
jgi:hypothetical protein